ncbi:hypothetical protein NG895_19220 [Aeoliella sp. ICT_H6.2]|uniref:CHAP domain-containing protein n=1 Tax=Aeoliella straminimaris TaxID=2954799 RepID=A0A9X2FII8_9BACT|nr:hypothetical protein [Aeoliella straminimaris]MCO6046036.1 hypothetical protein [Aeoliella straminimaris]
MLRILILALLVCPALPAAEPKGPNADVLEIAYSYKDGGTYQWKGSGVPEELCFAGEQILPKGEGTFCCGYTLSVVFKAAERRGLLEEKSIDDIRQLHKFWYGNSEASKETLVQYALEQLKLGQAIELDDAQPGDFAQFWRSNKSGHSVVFLEWVVDQGQRIGVKYRSSQKLTDGIGDRVEYFSDADGRHGKIDRDRFYIVRLNKPK